MKTPAEEIAYIIDGKTGERVPATVHSAPKVRGHDKKFIRGPIPLSWMHKAAGLSKSGMAVALAVAYCRGLEKKDTFKLRPARLRDLGVGRSAGGRGLHVLEQSGLISVLERHRGRSPFIKVMMWESRDIEHEDACVNNKPH